MSKVIYFNINYRCNLNCIFCFSNSTSDIGRELAAKMIFDALDYVFPKKFDLVVLNGGEPTLHSSFYSILRTIQTKYPSTIVVYTNGTTINFSEFSRSDKVIFVILIHGTQDLHDSVTRISGSFEKTLKNLKMLQERECKYRIKFILSRQMISSNFGIRDFLTRNNLFPEEVILARLNKTKKSQMNHVILPLNNELIAYLASQVKSLKDDYVIKFLDIPFCFMSITNIDLSIREVLDFFFCDVDNWIQDRKYYKEIMIGPDCSTCYFKDKCLLMKYSYLTLVLRKNTLRLEGE